MKKIPAFVSLTGLLVTLWPSAMFGSQRPAGPSPIIFAARIDNSRQFPVFLVMVESLRTFGGQLKDAPFWLYMPKAIVPSGADALAPFKAVKAEIKTFETPKDAAWYPLSSWVLSSAAAEVEAEGKASILAWLGGDTVFLQEPGEFVLPKGKALGYRPVFHRNICPLYDEPLDPYWKRAYELMGVKESSLFPMITPADGDKIRPYFQAGCLVVRPERGLVRKWREMFNVLSKDPAIREMCEKDVRQRTFTFQVGLTGAFLNSLSRDEMLEFSDRINYPIFFREMFGGKRDFHDITNAVTIRYEHFFSKPPAGWDRQLQGPADKIAWIKERLDKKS